ncbi:MAG: hypothetical protein MPJ78_17335 [Hyphomicrobiaceae bacterium]|nr:hypothetical protein [Hyphomicrobiaceae bacterium]
MTTEQATWRYFYVFIPSMIVYTAGVFGITWAVDHLALPAFALCGLAAIPIFAILCALWAHWRFITEIDEFLRAIQINAVLFGVAGVLVVATGWGTLEMLADAPSLQVFWLLPIFWAAYAAAAVVITKREGGVF